MRDDLGDEDVARFLRQAIGVSSMGHEQSFSVFSQNKFFRYIKFFHFVCLFEVGSRLVQNLHSSGLCLLSPLVTGVRHYTVESKGNLLPKDNWWLIAMLGLLGK